MLVIKLVHNNDLDLVKELQELRELLKKKNITIGLVESSESDSNLIKIMCEKDCYDEKVRRMIYLYISNILYNISISNSKLSLAKNTINVRHTIYIRPTSRPYIRPFSFIFFDA